MHNKQFTQMIAVLFLLGSFFLVACTNITPIDPQQPPSASLPPSTQPSDTPDYTVTYNYSDTGPVQLSSNNIVMKVGQTLVLQPIPGLTSKTHFTSSGEYYWGDIMEQQGDPQTSTKAVFKAIKPGKGKLTIIPNENDTARAVDLWVTVQS